MMADPWCAEEGRLNYYARCHVITIYIPLQLLYMTGLWSPQYFKLISLPSVLSILILGLEEKITP